MGRRPRPNYYISSFLFASPPPHCETIPSLFSCDIVADTSFCQARSKTWNLALPTKLCLVFSPIGSFRVCTSLHPPPNCSLLLSRKWMDRYNDDNHFGTLSFFLKVPQTKTVMLITVNQNEGGEDLSSHYQKWTRNCFFILFIFFLSY